MSINRRTILAAAGVGIAGAAAAEGARIDFETATPGSLPDGVSTGLTGGGGPVKWTIIEDQSAPAGPKVLAQTSTDKTDNRFPLAIFAQPLLANLDLAVKFKAVAGEVDRAGGIVLRLTDANNYYVLRANALEDNVRLYRVVKGNRIQFAGASAKVASGVWHELRLRAEGPKFEVFFNGRSLYTATDPTFANAGRVALWTKADSVTYFDALSVTPLP